MSIQVQRHYFSFLFNGQEYETRAYIDRDGQVSISFSWVCEFLHNETISGEDKELFATIREAFFTGTIVDPQGYEKADTLLIDADAFIQSL